MPRITISYRRDDSGVFTGRIFDRLAAHFGRDSVFRDIDNVPPGVDFRKHISQVLDDSDIVLAIVGPRWVGPARGPSRLANPADPVRLEIETVLRKGKPLIPVLVLRANMPRVEQLPESLQDFAYRNAVSVDASQDFDVHMARLIRAMEQTVTGMVAVAVPAGGGGTEAGVEVAQNEPATLDDSHLGGGAPPELTRPSSTEIEALRETQQALDGQLAEVTTAQREDVRTAANLSDEVAAVHRPQSLLVYRAMLAVLAVAVALLGLIVFVQRQHETQPAAPTPSTAEVKGLETRPQPPVAAPPPESTRTLAGHSLGVLAVAFSPDGRTLASGSRDTTVKLWDIAGARELRTLSGHPTPVESVAFSPDGRALASGSRSGMVKLWEVASGRELHTLSHSDWIWAVAFSPDGLVLASGSRDGTVKLWDIASGRELRTLSGDSTSIQSVAFSPDGRTLASGSKDWTIKLWDAATGSELRTLTGHFGPVRSVAFSPEGSTLTSGSDDRTVKLWDIASGRELRVLSGHSDNVRSVAFAPDGRTLASGSYDRTVKWWDVTSGSVLCTLTGHFNNVQSVAFSPDGRILGSGSDDNTIRLWNVSTETATGAAK